MKTVRLTMSQAIVKYLSAQYIEIDDEIHPLFAGVLLFLDMAMLLEWARHCQSVKSGFLHFVAIVNKEWFIQPLLMQRLIIEQKNDGLYKFNWTWCN